MRGRSMRLFVANLVWSTTAEELERLFAPYGIVDRTQIITDRETGRSRGYGFVDMPDATEVKAARYELNRTRLKGQPLRVREARQQKIVLHAKLMWLIGQRPRG